MDCIEVLKDYHDRLESLDPQQVILEVKRKVIGQDAFLEEFIPFLCLALRGRIRRIQGADEQSLPKLASAFIVGPTASGKTHTLKTVCKVVGIDFQFVDCSSLTGAGWRGNSVDDELLRIAQEQKQNPGVITLLIWDEADKMRFDGRQLQSGGSSFNAQHTLLKPLDGGLYHFEHGGKQYVADMDCVINLFAGAFTGIEDIVADRTRVGGTIGFNVQPEADMAKRRSDIQVDDFLEWGMLSELCGRCGAVFNLPALDSDSLAFVTKGAEFSFEAQFSKLAPQGCEFELDQSAVDYVVRRAQDSNLGVRAIENVLAAPVSMAFDKAQRMRTAKVVMVEEDGILSYRLEGELPPDDGATSDGEAKRSQDGRYPRAKAFEVSSEESKAKRIAIGIDRRCAQFDLNYFVGSDWGADAVAKVIADQTVEKGASVSSDYKRRRMASMVGFLISVLRRRGGEACTLGNLYAEAARAKHVRAYMASLDAEAKRSPESWAGWASDYERAQESLGEQFEDVAESLAAYLRRLTNPPAFHALKMAVYESIRPTTC